ncbi:MAG: methyltransferase domain-containing protein [Planctomyces sp.]|nr:methyltransferase domain-containing protein [Planctomyces sp.]
MKMRYAILCLACQILVAGHAMLAGNALLADEPAPEKPPLTNRKDGRYEWKIDHDPDGIGKFYMDREIAHVMGFQGAAWLERSSREEEERLTLLVKSIKLQPGDVVADIGAGSGVISLRMSEAVLPGGSIMAVDVQQEMLDRLKEHCDTYGVTNVVPVKGTEKSPELKPDTIDVALMVDVYHEFEYPFEMMQEISKAMKPGGRVIFVEYRKEDPSVPIKLVHKMTQKQVRKEIAQDVFQLKWTETIDVLPRQHIIVFTKQPAEGDVEKPKQP